VKLRAGAVPAGATQGDATLAGATQGDATQGDATQVGPGSTVFIPATWPHSIEADANNSLVFLAISAPAFTPQDYVLVQP
jgi:mannose-6-phosphate isomerase-like protein (cupin superfamily)